jgi:Clr5 domain
MDQDGEALPSVEGLHDIPYDKRWEVLKPAIIRFYMDENNRLNALSERMKNEYGFAAV